MTEEEKAAKILAEQKAKEEEIKKKQDAEQAPVPPPPPAFIREAFSQAKPNKLEPKPMDDKILADGADSDFWKLIKQRISDKINSLDSALAGAVQNKVGSEQIWLQDIGIRYLLKQIVSDNMADIINFVELRAKVAEEQKKIKANERE